MLARVQMRLFFIAALARFCHDYGAGALWAVFELLKEWDGPSERNG